MRVYEDRVYDEYYIGSIDKTIQSIREQLIIENRSPDYQETSSLNYLISKRAQANYILYSSKNF